MASETLATRILKETGIAVADAAGAAALAGMFDRYRPHGDGLERLLGNGAVERAVRDRLKAALAAAAPGNPPGVSRVTDAQLADILASWLRGAGTVADLAGDAQALRELALAQVVAVPSPGAAIDDDRATLLYETVTDFLARWQPGASPLFLLKEAVWSLADDYFLMAWILWPAHALDNDQALDALDGFFEAWRHRLRVVFFAGHDVGARRLPG